MGKLILRQNFRGFDIRGVPYVYINREIQGMPVCFFWLKNNYQLTWYTQTAGWGVKYTS